jgi:hypothetical protein
MATIIPEEDVSIETLHARCRRAFFRAKLDEDGELYVTGGVEFPIWVEVDDNRKFIRLFTFVSRDLSKDQAYTAEDANGLSGSVVLAAFFVDSERPERLNAHHFLPFEDGLIDASSSRSCGASPGP